jgi:phosphoenolpyruvate synthase/pyruvate phosphate dikinase
MIYDFLEVNDKNRQFVGGKASALSKMAQEGLKVPYAVFISTKAYNDYVELTGLRERISLELSRKELNLKEMRWEEMWDAALRIRNMFLTTPIPKILALEIKNKIKKFNKPVVVRSSAPGEDTTNTSFAGIHESYVNVKGTDNIIEHIKLVWASLWSDTALLYREERGLKLEDSSMAVVIQEIINGQRSGVAFSMSPNNKEESIIESVYGLNQGLVDGTIEPDRWILNRKTGDIKVHQPASLREKEVISSDRGVEIINLSNEKINTPPLNLGEVNKVFNLAKKAENIFGSPQDVEWTINISELYILQSRPITTIKAKDMNIEKSWYLNLKRSYENLKQLQDKITQKLIPDMIREAEKIEKQNIDLKSLSDPELVNELGKRIDIHQKWHDIYYEDFIPFAHGVRLFGQIYNDTVKPKDPYEFMDLLKGTNMVSIKRNKILERMAYIIKKDEELYKKLKKDHTPPKDSEFEHLLDDYMNKFGSSFFVAKNERDRIIDIVFQLIKKPTRNKIKLKKDLDKLKQNFLKKFKDKEFARQILELARISQRLRDDDNIYLGRIEGLMIDASREGIERLGKKGQIDCIDESINPKEVIKALRNLKYKIKTHGYQITGSVDRCEPTATREIPKIEKISENLRSRQLKGQPAGPGIVRGKARVIKTRSDLFEFKSGEILVIDALDPNMTFVIPLSSGIVERRGGMLIHGAIIAREYGLPCVTGISNAINEINTGDEITIDGYLGIVTIHRNQ